MFASSSAFMALRLLIFGILVTILLGLVDLRGEGRGRNKGNSQVSSAGEGKRLLRG